VTHVVQGGIELALLHAQQFRGTLAVGKMLLELRGHQRHGPVRSSPVALHPLIGGHDQLAEPRQIDVAGRRPRFGQLSREQLARESGLPRRSRGEVFVPHACFAGGPRPCR
jgi:hypothetical protein